MKLSGAELYNKLVNEYKIIGEKKGNRFFAQRPDNFYRNQRYRWKPFTRMAESVDDERNC